MPTDRRMLFIEALAGISAKPTRRRRGSARCYGPPCEINDCPGQTVGNKPYCLDHVHLMPYAAKIQEREAARDVEIASADGPPLDGFVAQDLLGAIKLTQSSIPALARDLRVPQKVVDKLVRQLIKLGKVRIRRSKRSVYVIRIPDPSDDFPGSAVEPPDESSE